MKRTRPGITIIDKNEQRYCIICGAVESPENEGLIDDNYWFCSAKCLDKWYR